MTESFEEWFRRESGGYEWPQCELGFTKMFADAGFSPTEEREIRTKLPADSDVSEYWHTPGVLWTAITARLKQRGTATPILTTEVTSTNELRDAWMYSEKKAGKTHGEIRFSLKRDHTDWEQIDSDQGIGLAIDRYCNRNKLALLRRKLSET